MIRNRGYVRIGKGCRIDPGAVIGHMPSRKIADLMLTIGDGASIRSGTVIYLGSTIGDGFETGHNVLVREQNIIGNEVKVWSNSVIDYRCRIGNEVKIHCNSYVAQLAIIEDGVFLAPGVTLANEKLPTASFEEENIRGPVVQRGARIGINSSILPGVVVGMNSLVGAGSVVTKDIPPNSVVCGVPARLVRTMGIDGTKMVSRQ